VDVVEVRVERAMNRHVPGREIEAAREPSLLIAAREDHGDIAAAMPVPRNADRRAELFAPGAMRA